MVYVVQFRSPSAWDSMSASSEVDLMPFLALWRGYYSDYERVSVGLVKQVLGLGRSTSDSSGSEVSLGEFDGVSRFLSVVSTCYSFSFIRSTSVAGLRGPAVTFEKMQVS